MGRTRHVSVSSPPSHPFLAPVETRADEEVQRLKCRTVRLAQQAFSPSLTNKGPMPQSATS
jgi:hypothetical protein